jgi:hypothetical protein
LVTTITNNCLFVMKGILADVLKCLGDNKKHMRECTLTALDSLVAAAQLEKMVPYIIVSLGDQKTVQKGEKISLIGCLSMFQK